MFLFLSTHKPILLYLHFSLVTQKIADFVEKLLKLPHLLWQVCKHYIKIRLVQTSKMWSKLLASTVFIQKNDTFSLEGRQI